MKKDNWEHRSSNMICETCMWYIPKLVGKKETEVGRCRRNAPTISGFPVVFYTDWCGNHKIDENKI